MSVVVTLDSISKRYRLGTTGGYRRLTEVLGQRFRPRSSTDNDNEFWALKDVSFDVREGEVVGIIGRNGAGKSTLLKILSRITEPTSGRAVLHGRVGSLLEVGTGFHPELTGRENVYLNGAVLGMRRSEIARRFDEIVAFAEVEQFLDTPVKRYSSGMYVRLAFAVAAHLEPEILVVDEVLAVGDTAFQKKCLGKMGDVAKTGRTVLFVSHNMAAVSGMCDRAVLLESGSLAHDGPTAGAIERYLADTMPSVEQHVGDRRDRSGTGEARIIDVTVRPALGSGTIVCDSRIDVILRYASDASTSSFVFVIGIFDESGTEIYALDSEAVGGFKTPLPKFGSVQARSGPLNLTPGRCYVNVAIVSGGLLDGGTLIDHVERALTFDVEASDFFGTGRMRSRDWSMCLIDQAWSLEADHGPSNTEVAP